MFEYDDVISTIQDNLDILYDSISELIEGTAEYGELEFEIEETEAALEEAVRGREEALQRMREEADEEYGYAASASEILDAANALGDPELWQAFRDAGGTNGSDVDLDSLPGGDDGDAALYIKESRGWEE